MGQSLQYVAQPRIRLLAVDLCSLDQAVDLGTGRSVLGRVAEQPGLATNDKRLDRALSQIVVDWQITSLDVTHQPAPVIRQIIHGLAQHALRRHLGLGLVQPTFQLGQGWQALRLSRGKTLLENALVKILS